jgi:hypothetical protein
MVVAAASRAIAANPEIIRRFMANLRSREYVPEFV